MAIDVIIAISLPKSSWIMRKITKDDADLECETAALAIAVHVGWRCLCFRYQPREDGKDVHGDVDGNICWRCLCFHYQPLSTGECFRHPSHGEPLPPLGDWVSWSHPFTFLYHIMIHRLDDNDDGWLIQIVDHKNDRIGWAENPWTQSHHKVPLKNVIKVSTLGFVAVFNAMVLWRVVANTWRVTSW